MHTIVSMKARPIIFYLPLEPYTSKLQKNTLKEIILSVYLY